MTKLSEDQLNNLCKEELVNMFLLMQENMSILQERLAVMNENAFGRKTEKLSAESPFFMNSYFAFQSGRALNSSVLEPARSSLISWIRTANSGTNSTTPSGMIATPKFMPFAARSATESAMESAIC